MSLKMSLSMMNYVNLKTMNMKLSLMKMKHKNLRMMMINKKIIIYKVKIKKAKRQLRTYGKNNYIINYQICQDF